jgi:hypothetical protein
MKGHVSRRIFAALLALAVMLTLLPAARAADEITVYMDFEGYNLGQGFYIEPVKMTVPAGITAGEATEMLLSSTGHEYDAAGGGDTFYLAAVRGFGVGQAVVFPGYLYAYPGFAADVAANRGRSDPEWLGEFDYTSMSGWIIAVNNVIIGHGAGAETPRDGDVIRWQFTVEGLGADLGLLFNNEIAEYGPTGAGIMVGEELLFTQCDKDALIRALFADTATVAAVAAAKDVIINPLASAGEIAGAIAALTAGNSGAGAGSVAESGHGAEIAEVAEPEEVAAVAAEWVNPFGDVADGDWYFEAVRYVTANGLMNGVEGGRFAPHTRLTRAMMITILARCAGIDTSGGETWYSKAAEWARGAGVSDGGNPGADITRRQLATMLYRYAGIGADGWGGEAMEWARSAGILNDGRGEDTATRAEVAAILQRFVELYA